MASLEYRMYDSKGTVYLDQSSKGRKKDGTTIKSSRYVAEIVIDGKRFRHRSVNKSDCEDWLASLQKAIILPTQNGRDWREQKPADILALKQLPDLPNYYFDLKQEEVWSFKVHNMSGKRKWRKLLERHHPKQKSGFYVLIIKGKNKYVTFGRAAFCIQHNIPYSSSQLDFFNIYYRKGKCVVEDKSQAVREGKERSRESSFKNRKEEVMHNIEVLQKLVLAYDGDSKPLIEYVYGRKSWYKKVLCSSPYCMSRQRADIAFRLGLDKLLRVIEEGGSKILAFDRWFLNTSRGLLNQVYDKNSRHINIEKVRRKYMLDDDDVV